ncbi:arginine--tRNA ligase [Conexibacter woesei]|uniref:arginine--tRNA ligase domain-containing protein n=1 Tax=Conexibacter woesei TaxID=191495 RepID=UPI00040A107F|nr:arginine--tRNA ligase [Conexibacter woesei]
MSTQSNGTPEGDDARDGIPRGAEHLGRLRAAVREISTEDHGLSLETLRSPGRSDLAVNPRGGSVSEDALAEAAGALAEQPDVEAADPAGRRIMLRLDDAVIAALGADLERGVADLPPAEDASLHGRHFMIQFLDPNATKALHVGHLRNVALGQALRCGLRAAGADAWSRTAIGDAGQQMGEAMAGCIQYGGGHAQRAPGVHGDRVVGEWYARYVQEHRDAALVMDEDEAVLASIDQHLVREVVVRDDLATQLMAKWEAGDPEVRALWRDIRDWAVEGQNETLARLGVVFDVEISEAESFPRIRSFVEHALAQGAMTYAENGALVYLTGDEDYPVFPLARPDGFPTQNLRTLNLWYELMQELEGHEVINVVGEEWRAHTIYVQEILRRMGMEQRVLPTVDVVHGMITATDDGEGEMSSSAGGVVLVDELLDTLASSEALQALAIPDRAGSSAEDLAVMAALAYCLNRPLSKTMVLNAEKILDPKAPGMLIARAWSKAWQPSSDGAPDPRADDSAYRFAVVHCQLQPDVLARGLETVDLAAVLRSVTHMATWYGETDSSPSVDRVMRSLLVRGLRALGVQSVPVAFEAGAERVEGERIVS